MDHCLGHHNWSIKAFFGPKKIVGVTVSHQSDDPSSKLSTLSETALKQYFKGLFGSFPPFLTPNYIKSKHITPHSSITTKLGFLSRSKSKNKIQTLLQENSRTKMSSFKNLQKNLASFKIKAFEVCKVLIHGFRDKVVNSLSTGPGTESYVPGND